LRKLHPAIIIILLLALACSAGYAADTGTPPEAAARDKEDDRLPIQKQDEWQFFLSPSVWIPGVNTNTTTLRKTTNIDVPWWEVASTLFSKSIGTMGRA
jgi:hypothetical protein